jgi:hypothetical protein
VSTTGGGNGNLIIFLSTSASDRYDTQLPWQQHKDDKLTNKAKKIVRCDEVDKAKGESKNLAGKKTAAGSCGKERWLVVQTVELIHKGTTPM